jgi:carbon monoxide dehydrogenase subunit G
MSVVNTSIRLDAPQAEVWDLVMDPARLGDWVSIHRRLLHADGGRARVGYEMEQQISMRGVSLDIHWRLIECATNELAVWQGRGPAHSRALTEYKLSAEDGGTRFDYRNEFRAPLGPIGALASRALVGGMPEREARRSLERLSAHLKKRSAER